MALRLPRSRLDVLDTVVLRGDAPSAGTDVQAAETIRLHIHTIVTYSQHPVTNAMSEGLNIIIQKI